MMNTNVKAWVMMSPYSCIKLIFTLRWPRLCNYRATPLHKRGAADDCFPVMFFIVGGCNIDHIIDYE